MTLALPPDLIPLRDAICALGAEKRDLLLEAVRLETEPEAAEIPQWHLDILEQREQAVLAGQSIPVPWDEARERIKERLARRHDA